MKKLLIASFLLSLAPTAEAGGRWRSWLQILGISRKAPTAPTTNRGIIEQDFDINFKQKKMLERGIVEPAGIELMLAANGGVKSRHALPKALYSEHYVARILKAFEDLGAGSEGAVVAAQELTAKLRGDGEPPLNIEISLKTPDGRDFQAPATIEGLHDLEKVYGETLVSYLDFSKNEIGALDFYIEFLRTLEEADRPDLARFLRQLQPIMEMHRRMLEVDEGQKRRAVSIEWA